MTFFCNPDLPLFGKRNDSYSSFIFQTYISIWFDRKMIIIQIFLIKSLTLMVEKVRVREKSFLIHFINKKDRCCDADNKMTKNKIDFKSHNLSLNRKKNWGGSTQKREDLKFCPQLLLMTFFPSFQKSRLKRRKERVFPFKRFFATPTTVQFFSTLDGVRCMLQLIFNSLQSHVA
jgi:hypothetical protein